EKNVAQIVTFNTLAARAVLKDVGRALEFPLSRVDALTKQVPSRPKVTLADALKEVPELQRECDRDPDVKRLFDIARRLEGLARNPGVHAAGVVVADTDLSEYVPLQKNGDVVTTQWEMSILEKVGMLKVDFLGLRNLTLLTAAVKLIQSKRDSNFDLAKLPLDDVKSYQLMQRGETKGVFQLESEGIRNLLIKMKPDRFADVIATNALYRPGPLGGGMVDKYIAVKHGRERAEYSHKVMKDVLEETYGVMVYQEQVMRILNRLGGIDLASSYKCIKAISKKDTAIIVKNKEQFVEGARQQGLAADKANEIFELIEYFAGYGFNKSHSTAYALVAYQTAYLKAHYPAEFMAALMSSEVDKTDLLAEHIEDCRRIGLQVKPPDVNHGESAFTVEGKVIRFGLLAIKGVGEKAVESIVAEREKSGPFRSIFDFCERVDHKLVTKSCVESLVKAGAFDGLGNRRRQLFDVLPTALQAGISARAARDAGQGMLFGGDADDAPQTIAMALPDLPEWADQERLGYERALLGVYLSSHPLAEHERTLRLFRSHPVNELRDLPHGREVVLGGMISAKRVLTTKKGRNANQRYARFAFEDLSGSASCVMFADQFAEYGERLVDDAVVFVRAEVDASVRPGTVVPREGEEPAAQSQEISLIVNEVIAFDDAPRKLSGSFVVRLDGARAEAEHVDRLAKLLQTRPGNSPVFIEILAIDGLRARMRAGTNIQVTCDQELARMVED
ncbi:MAG TPA: DNA polymerase III subunit alpha, partial [Planctomycetia bacterium]|nr:DNA polymerase III subunit alpha [Planctomycetia bacterium]